MTRKISIIVIIAIAFFALLQCNVFAAETLPEAVDGVITLTEDVILTKPAVIDGTVTLNLNGKTIKNTTNIWVDTDEINDWSLISVRGGNLTINGNGTLAAKDGDCYAVDVQKGTLTINGGTYIGNISAVYVLEGLATINGGTYSVQQTDPKGGQNGYGYTLNCLDANYKNKSANIKVTGGTYSNYDPSDAAEIADPKNYVVAGYKSVAEGESYKIVEDDDYNFQKALNDGGTVTLTKNLVLTKPAVVSGTVTLNLNGKTIKNTTDIWVDTDEINDWSLISVRGGNLTINGNGTLAAKDGDCYAVDVQKGTLTINGGEYIGNCSAIYIRTEGTVVINDGVFSIKQLATSGNGYGETVNCKDQYYKEGTAKVFVTGGKYYKYDPSNAAEPNKPQTYVVEGYKVVANGDYYEVVDAHTKLTKTDAKAATYTTNGNIEYYTCSICGKLFEDKEATKETNAIEVVIPMLIQVNGGNASVGDVVVDEAIKDSGNSSVVEIPAVGNATSVTVPVESVKAVDEANKGLTVETKDTTVTLDAKAVEEVAKQAGNATEITIEVTKTEEKTLNKEQKEAIKDKEVAIVLSAKILADGKEISNFNGGKVKVEIPFTPAEGTKGSDYKVYYVADDGKVTAIPTRYVKEKLVVELEHFSEYVVVKEVATAAPAPSAPAANPNEKDNTPKTGAISVIGLVVAMSVIGLAVLRKRD